MGKNVVSIFYAAILLCTSLVRHGAAQSPARASAGWGPSGAYERLFDAAKIETVAGEVVAVEIAAPMREMPVGVQLQLKSEAETLIVHLGPAWYLEKQIPQFQPKDRIQVRGYRVGCEQGSVIIASDATRGDETLALRDPEGTPYWIGRR